MKLKMIKKMKMGVCMEMKKKRKKEEYKKLIHTINVHLSYHIIQFRFGGILS